MAVAKKHRSNGLPAMRSAALRGACGKLVEARKDLKWLSGKGEHAKVQLWNELEELEQAEKAEWARTGEDQGEFV